MESLSELSCNIKEALNIKKKPSSVDNVKRFTIYDSIMKNRLLYLQQSKNTSDDHNASKTFYLKIREGFIGESEFLSRSTYSCCAKVIAETTICEIEFDTFWNLVKKHKLEGNRFTFL